jgi:hypothetical protein
VAGEVGRAREVAGLGELRQAAVSEKIRPDFATTASSASALEWDVAIEASLVDVGGHSERGRPDRVVLRDSLRGGPVS